MAGSLPFVPTSSAGETVDRDMYFANFFFSMGVLTFKQLLHHLIRILLRLHIIWFATEAMHFF